MKAKQFTELPEEKRLRIQNAGFEVFGTYEYQRASTDMIAKKAGISKGLLYYYFTSKKLFYLSLFEYAVDRVKEAVMDEGFAKIQDFFELCEYAAEKKYQLLVKNPYLLEFVMRAFYSKGEEVSGALNEKVGQMTGDLFGSYFSVLDYSKFKPDVNPREILQMLTWMTDGYLHEQQRAGLPVSMDDLMEKFRRWSSMLKEISYQKEFLP